MTGGYKLKRRISKRRMGGEDYYLWAEKAGLDKNPEVDIPKGEARG